jgi:hypothetical protein
MAIGLSEDIGMTTKQSLLSERTESVFRQVDRLEKLIGIGKVAVERMQSTPVVSKFDELANALDEIQSRLAQCNIELEKL